MTRKEHLGKLREVGADIERLGAELEEAHARLSKAAHEQRDLLDGCFAPMSEEMHERVNECIRYQLAKDIAITAEYIDHGMVNSAGCFAAYTPWGIACIEQAFRERMRCPEPGESKRRIKRDIQTNMHLHPKIKRRLFKTLARAHVRFNWRQHLDRHYCDRIQRHEGPIEALEAEIVGNSNLPDVMRENLLYNLRQCAA